MTDLVVRERQQALPWKDPDGYLRIIVPGQGQMAQHRLVLFDKIGYGPHLCHWCRCHINWRMGLYTDHLNSVRDDNRPENLVPSCNPCNWKRGRQ